MIDNRGRQTDVKRKKQREFRNAIIKQIHEKQEERIDERRSRYQEGVKLEEEAKARRQRLEEAKIRKLNELRFACSTLTPRTRTYAYRLLDTKVLVPSLQLRAGRIGIFSVGLASLVKQESLANAKVSARQPWYIRCNSQNRPPLRIAQQYQHNL